MTEIPPDILNRATRTFRKSLREHEDDYVTAVADALHVGAALFAAHELRVMAWLFQAQTAHSEASQLRQRAERLVETRGYGHPPVLGVVDYPGFRDALAVALRRAESRNSPELLLMTHQGKDIVQEKVSLILTELRTELTRQAGDR